MFDNYLASLGGYSLFSLMSELGSHPGFAGTRFAEFPGDPDLQAIIRSYTVRGQLLLLKDITRIVAVDRAWEISDDLAVDLLLADALMEESARRFFERAWPQLEERLHDENDPN
jgi:hypothetical protein